MQRDGSWVSSRSRDARVAEQGAEYGAMTPAQAVKRIKELEQRMYEHARNLEFEEAGRQRDEIRRLEKHALGRPDVKTA